MGQENKTLRDIVFEFACSFTLPSPRGNILHMCHRNFISFILKGAQVLSFH